MDVASTALLEIQMEAMMQVIDGLDFNLEPSPYDFHGLVSRGIPFKFEGKQRIKQAVAY